MRPGPSAIVLDGEDVTVEGRRPLLAFHCHLEIPQSVPDVSLNFAPIKLRVAVDHIGRAGEAQLHIHPVLDELVIERRYSGSPNCPMRSAARTNPASVSVSA